MKFFIYETFKNRNTLIAWIVVKATELFNILDHEHSRGAEDNVDQLVEIQD